MKMKKERKNQRMKQLFSYFLAALILSVSSIALVAALVARDVFGQADPYVVIVFLLLGVLYFICLVLMDRLQNVKKMVRG